MNSYPSFCLTCDGKWGTQMPQRRVPFPASRSHPPQAVSPVNFQFSGPSAARLIRILASDGYQLNIAALSSWLKLYPRIHMIPLIADKRRIIFLLCIPDFDDGRFIFFFFERLSSEQEICRCRKVDQFKPVRNTSGIILLYLNTLNIFVCGRLSQMLRKPETYRFSAD